MPGSLMSRGIFIGLTTVDLIYYAPKPPSANEKVVATDLQLAAGGPATNAAVIFAALGGKATLLSVIGQHPLTQLIQDDLANCQVNAIDLDPRYAQPPSLSAITVSESTGDRAIISKNAQGQQRISCDISGQLVEQCEAHTVLLIDGHQQEVGLTLAQRAALEKLPVVLDGGSWKPGLEKLLPYVNYMICSANFHPPNCGNELEIVQFLHQYNPNASIAITHGEHPISVYATEQINDIPCPHIQPIDTLGAGDFFHGAFCAAILQQDFESSLRFAAAIASQSCQFRGTRQWLSELSFNDISPIMRN